MLGSMRRFGLGKQYGAMLPTVSSRSLRRYISFFVLEMLFWTRPKGGGYSVSRKIVIAQALPAILALILL